MQYIHWNKRPYIHAGAVRRKDIFIWFITLFHLIHEQLASWDRREWGRLVLSSVTLYSMILRNRERVAKRGQEREREKRNWVVLLFFVGMLQCHKYQSLLTGHNKDIPEWYHTLTTVNARYGKREEALNENGVETGCCLRIHCMINYT